VAVKLPRAGDALITVSVLLIAAVSAVSSEPIGGSFREWDALGFALMIAQVLPLLWRQQAPRAVAWSTTAVWIVIQGLGYPASLAVISPFIAVYGLAAYTPKRTAYTHVALIGGVLLSWTAVGILSTEFVDLNALISVLFGVILPFALGFVEHDRADRIAELERVQARQEQAEAEAARVAVTTERTRIARELHDVVAHEMTVMTLQAEGARRLAGDADPRLGEALATIASAGRSGLAEMQRMIGVLRESADGETPAGLTPAPTLADVPALARQVRESGMPVRLSITGDASLPAGVELNAFRLIQEALTNALKYAGPGASATVEVRKAPDAVTVTVKDDGRGASAAGSGGGHGLVGMRERVEALGGKLDVGPAAGGGYRLHAVLPVVRRTPEPTRVVGTLTGPDA
jgi:signal transduction histidine kinase